jgi:hypothetical protein
MVGAVGFEFTFKRSFNEMQVAGEKSEISTEKFGRRAKNQASSIAMSTKEVTMQ